MRWKVGVLGALMVFVSGVSFGAIERVLIDFANYEDKITKVLQNEKKSFDELRARYAEQGRKIGETNDLIIDWFGGDENSRLISSVWFDPKSWGLDNWEVILAPSARNVENVVLSYAKKVYSTKTQWGIRSSTAASNSVLGARIHFIKGNYLSWAIIKPPFEFFAYYDNGDPVDPEGDLSKDPNSIPKEDRDVKAGVLMNVGQIKQISVWVAGRNYKHQLAIRLKNEKGETEEYFMGSLYFDGWRKLTWENPNYIQAVVHRTLTRLPLYPMSMPYKKFDSFVIYKPIEEPGGDFVVYFKEVGVKFDRAILREEYDIDDEKWWHILSDRKIKHKKMELKKVMEVLELRRQELARQRAQMSSKETTGGGGKTVPGAGAGR